MPNLYNYSHVELCELLEQWSEKPFRAGQIMRWIYHQGADNFDMMHNVPKALRARMHEQLCFDLPSVEQEHVSSCGTTKWLMHLGDGNAFETVYIPEKNRGTLCISSQIGCALACQFCATGLAGFYKNLSTADIVGQVLVARNRLRQRLDIEKPITNIVFMGMGEPLLNEHNVFRAVSILLDDLGFGLSKYRVTISTSGITPAMMRLVDQTNAALAVSLHACNDELRSKLVPINKKYSIADLMKSCDYYTQHTRRPITYEYVMLAGHNDSEQHARELIQLLGPRHAKINLIPYNSIPDLDLACSSDERIHAFCAQLIQSGLRCTIRKTRGDDIAAACGQLFGSVVKRKKSIAPYQFLRSTALSNH